MPTYEYQCDACGHNFDEFQSFSDEPLKKCPQCKKSKLRRAFGTGAAIIFKGSGFYQTDYPSESYKAGAKADQEKSSGKPDQEKSGGTSKADATSSTSDTSSTSNTNGTGSTDSGGKSTKAKDKSSKSKT